MPIYVAKAKEGDSDAVRLIKAKTSAGAKSARVALNTARSSVDRIEHRLRAPILRRSVGGCEPTEVGKQLLDTARHIRSTIGSLAA